MNQRGGRRGALSVEALSVEALSVGTLSVEVSLSSMGSSLALADDRQ
jgi:hypothetical protein